MYALERMKLIPLSVVDMAHVSVRIIATAAMDTRMKIVLSQYVLGLQLIIQNHVKALVHALHQTHVTVLMERLELIVN
jgi:hypothetical protein